MDRVVVTTACVVCQERERDLENNLLCCPRCAGRLAGALRQIPVLVDELHGLGYVERDTRPGTRALRVPVEGEERTEVIRVPAMADPVANLVPAGPLAGASTGPRAGGTRERSLPIRVDPTDLLARPRYGSLLVAGRTPYPDDQVGHLPVATTLDFWVRDWADIRGEGLPDIGTVSPVALLCGWLEVRLDWALREHGALDEFAGDVSRLLGALYGLAGLGLAAPKLMEAPCPSCRLLALTQPFPEAYIECVCGRCLTPAEYEEYVMDMRHEVTAQDVLRVLNSLHPVPLDGVRFAVITQEWMDVDTPSGTKRRFSSFGRGDLLALDKNGREILGDERKPAKHPCEFRDFASLDEAEAFRVTLLWPDNAQDQEV